MSPEGALRDRPAAGFELIETLRWEPGSGFLRLDRHLSRLARSARTLGFACDPEQTSRALADAVQDAGAALRVRLALAQDGVEAVATAPFVPIVAGTVWRLGLAETRLSSADPLVRHKTSRREAYARARTEFAPEEADEVILLNERDEVCEGTITSLFVDRRDGGPLLTPPLRCGLLAGVLRAELLDQGRAVEHVLTRDDIAAHALLVGNSLRGLVPATLL